VILHAFQARLSSSPILKSMSPEVRQEMMAHSIDLAATPIPRAAEPQQVLQLKRAIDDSFLVAFRLAMWSCVGLAVLSSIMAARWIGES